MERTGHRRRRWCEPSCSWARTGCGHKCARSWSGPRAMSRATCTSTPGMRSFPQTPSGCGLTLWQVRGPDVSGEITKAYAADLEAHGADVRKVRALRQMEDLQNMQHMVEAMKTTHPDKVREARQIDRRPLKTWSNANKTVLIGDAAHAMYPGPGEGARTSFEDAHQLCNLLQEVFAASPGTTTTLEDAVTRFEKIRIPRASRIQAYAAERTYWPEYIPEWAQKLTEAEKAQRSKEYVKWVLQYPECMLGDPDSTYWKP